MNRTDNRRVLARAFTLIELLIVVAIIAILAAIAVPNFLEAQTRSKVSRVKADIRTLVTAIESYHVDNNAFPPPSDATGAPIRPGRVTEWFETRMPTGLTTPVAYMTGIPSDVFAAAAGELPLLHYTTRDYVIRIEGDDHEFRELAEAMLGTHRLIEYYILSHGPDLDHDFAALGHHHEADGDDGHDEDDHGHGHDHDHDPHPALYDPTNGTVSNGDIVYFGPGLGFGN